MNSHGNRNLEYSELPTQALIFDFIKLDDTARSSDEGEILHEEDIFFFTRLEEVDIEVSTSIQNHDSLEIQRGFSRLSLHKYSVIPRQVYL